MPTVVQVALSPVKFRLGRERMFGKLLDELLENFDSQFEISDRRGLRYAISFGQPIAGFGDQGAASFFRDIIRQKILPGLAGFRRLSGIQLCLPQLKLGLGGELRGGSPRAGGLRLGILIQKQLIGCDGFTALL